MILFSFNSTDDENIELSAEEFKQKLESRPGVVIDVRTPEEYGSGHLKIVNAQYNWNNGEFHDAVDALDRDQTYYLYCRSGNRSGQAARMMKEKGFKNVYNAGGFQELADFGFDMEK